MHSLEEKNHLSNELERLKKKIEETEQNKARLQSQLEAQNLEIYNLKLFGKQHQEWKREAIESVRVEVEEYRTSESISFDHFISVKPASDSERQWFSHLGKDELEWMAASIQKHLDLDAGEE